MIIGFLAYSSVIFGLFTPSDDWREFSQSIALILIPIVAGGITTKFTTDSWQITKEKLEIKRKILLDFEESYKRISLLYENFVYRILETYIQYSETSNAVRFEEYDREDHGIKAYLAMPHYTAEKPKNKLKTEYESFLKEFQKASLIQNRFFSSMRLYYGNDDLEKKIKDEIEKSLEVCADLVLRMLYSDSAQELKKYHTKFKKENKKTVDQIRELENEMVSLGFREISL